MVSIIDFKNEVSTLNEKIFELQKQIEYYQKLLVSKNKQQNMLDHEKQLLNFFYQRYYEDLQCISTYYNQPNNREIFEIIYDVRRFYFDNANTINSLSLITFFGLCYFKYHFT
jgi:vacuolar-type H+-ATPase subunit C/Vma6